MSTPPTPTTNDRTAELKSFDATKQGVKGLSDSHPKTLPLIFHHPSLSLSSTSAVSIPTIDLSLPLHVTVPLLSSAAHSWGFFQLTNHSLPPRSLSSAISSVQSFHSLPGDLKCPFYTRDLSSGVAFSSNFDLFLSQAASWRDTLQIGTSPVLNEEKIPDVCRKEVVEWDRCVRELAGRVLGMLAEGLGVEKGRLEGLSMAEGRMMVCHYYPPCPEPEKTLGIAGHTDPGALTMLVQNHVEGLQVRKDGGMEWVNVKPIPGAVIVNVGDLLQIISNDEYRSVEHRVVASSNPDARVSIAVFLNPSKRGDSDLYGPLPELISEAKPARYRSFTMTEFMKTFFGKQLGSKALVDHFRL